jgi:hypothetical protein
VCHEAAFVEWTMEIRSRVISLAGYTSPTFAKLHTISSAKIHLIVTIALDASATEDGAKMVAVRVDR